MAPIDNQCAICSKPGKLCASCENIHYCDSVCQKTDWKVHKLLCHTFEDSREPPGPNMMRVIVFPFNTTKLEFRWLPIKPGKTQCPDFGSFFGVGSMLGANKPALVDFRSFVQDPKTGVRLHHCITVMFRDGYKNDGSITSIAVHNLTGGPCISKLARPVLAYGNIDSLENEDVKCTNLDTSDLNVIKDWFAQGFYKCKNEQLYADRLNANDNFLDATAMFEMSQDVERELLTRGLTMPTNLQNLGLKERLQAVDAFKKVWDAKIKARASKKQQNFSASMDADELAWRKEMQTSGRITSQSSDYTDHLKRQTRLPEEYRPREK
ncbi:hypothetical protein E4T42_01855 [Aureobasidium subglaciale]|nr:hypothetical protein E4T42_01855 [Aureobasidium subglaciale]